VNIKRHDPWVKQFETIDVLHHFSCVSGGQYLLSYARARGIGTVLSSSLWLEDDTLSAYPIADIQQIIDHADLIVTNSIAEQEMLERFFPGVGARCRPVYNGIDLRFLEPTITAKLKQWVETLPPRFILNVGNIEPRKNQFRLVQAAKDLDVPVVLIGHVRDQAYWEKVQASARCDLRYLGGFPFQSPEIYAAMQKATVFVLPSMLETPGLAALEAGASGTRQVVVTSVGSTREYFGDLVSYVEPKSVESIRSALEFALNNKGKAELQRQMKQQFNWATVCKRLVEIYEEAAEIAGRR
jgi:glycosyltransferase involved in cell wall biosynthesis